MKFNPDQCTACGQCAAECPLGAAALVEKRPVFGPGCVRCGLCVAVCPAGALAQPEEPPAGTLVCDHCPVACAIPADRLGACQRYRNQAGAIAPARPLLLPPEADLERLQRASLISQPLITAVGAGGTYPDYQPAPLAVQARRAQVDVVTVVTESPLTYSSLLLKIDAERPIGPETAPVKHRGAVVGHVTTEQYGSKMLSLGGINVMKGPDRLKAVRLIVAACNGEPVKLRVEGGARLTLQAGRPPVIDGVESKAMKIACGAAIMGMFGPRLKDLADEIIVLDADITGLFSESHVGQEFGFAWRGLRPPGRYATPGRYFGEPGEGWGGTPVVDPAAAFEVVDPALVWTGMRVLVLEVTGRRAALLEADQAKAFHLLPLPAEVAEMRDLIAANAEPSLTSVIYTGGCGGSARSGVTAYPIKLNQAVHAGRVRLSVGGVPAHVLPGGGINFLVEAGRSRWRPFTWTPAPAVVAPLEYTMERQTYLDLGGHRHNLRLLSDLKAERACREWDQA